MLSFQLETTKFQQHPAFLKDILKYTFLSESLYLKQYPSYDDFFFLGSQDEAGICNAKHQVQLL